MPGRADRSWWPCETVRGDGQPVRVLLNPGRRVQGCDVVSVGKAASASRAPSRPPKGPPANVNGWRHAVATARHGRSAKESPDGRTAGARHALRFREEVDVAPRYEKHAAAIHFIVSAARCQPSSSPIWSRYCCGGVGYRVQRSSRYFGSVVRSLAHGHQVLKLRILLRCQPNDGFNVF